MTKKRKQNVKSMFLKGLLQSFFIVAILLSAGVLGYHTTLKLWMTEKTVSERAKAPEPTPQPITTASVDDISKNLIYCYDQAKGKITSLVLEIFHCEKKQITYITIPLNTQFTMSDTLYKKLIVVQPATPQIIRLSSVTKYFEPDTVFDYGVLLIEDMLKLKISYYTVIPKELYDTIFSEQEIIPGMEQREENSEAVHIGKTGKSEKTGKTGEGEEIGETGETVETGEVEEAGEMVHTGKAGEGEETSETGETEKVPVEVFTDDYWKFLDGINTEEDIKSYIEELYPSLITNLSLQDKMNYLESYKNTTSSSITFTRLPGMELNSGFVLDETKASKLLSELIAY